jgi:branched-subunit amino acid ABC-type transport system permease component
MVTRSEIGVNRTLREIGINKVLFTIGIMLIAKMVLKVYFQPNEYQTDNGTAYRKSKRI